jgi:hypothetical protein
MLRRAAVPFLPALISSDLVIGQIFFVATIATIEF